MERILGQQRAIDVLTAARRSCRLHHAWIFSGPRGVGKFTTALAFAAQLLEGGDGGRATRLVEAGTHPDLHVIRKELALHSADPEIRKRKLLSIPLDVLREWMIGGFTGAGKYFEAAAFKTAQLGGAKVFIVDEAELLAADAQNALLKTLEEPPPKTYLFLITTRPQRLLPTIHSRCQHVTFGPLDDEAMATWLKRAALDLDDEERAWILRYSAGSPGLATIAAEYGLAKWAATLRPMLDELAGGGFPTRLGETMAGLVEEYATGWVKGHENASKDAANKDGVRHVLAILAGEAGRALAAGVDDPLAAEAAAGTIELIRDAERQLESNVNQKLVLENLAAQWASRPAASV